MKRSPASCSGFTLIELLVTVFVLAIGLGTMFALVTMTASMGRDQRDEARVRRFAETVFASVDWGLNGNLTTDPFSLDVLTAEGVVTGRLILDGTESVWPPMGANELEPRRIRYQVNWVKTAEGLVEVTVQAGMWGELEQEIFTRTFLGLEPGF